MPLIKPSFTIPNKIPLIGGQWGPYLVTTGLTSSQKRGIFGLFFITFALIVCFTALSYYYVKNKPLDCKGDFESKTATKGGLSEFLNGGVDKKGFLIGMGAGLIFGFIDNAGLFYGMSYLDPVFNPKKVPWVYGKGGRRVYSGLDRNEDVVYRNIKFTDGKMNEKEIQEFKNIAKNLERTYEKQYQLPESDRDNIHTNEEAYANPKSEMFLGANMSRKEFIENFKSRKIGEELYYHKIEDYRTYLNGEKIKGRNGEEESEIKGDENGNRNHRKKQKWPGIDKSLVEASLGGWKPGSLTQAGIGNTYSDFLGTFLSTFIGAIIISSSNMCVTSLLSEVFGVVIGCILGILIGRSSYTPGSRT